MRLVKTISAIVLFSALWMPLSSCTTFIDANGNLVHVNDKSDMPPGIEKTKMGTVRIFGGPWSDADQLDNPVTWFVLFAFSWPVLAVGTSLLSLTRSVFVIGAARFLKLLLFAFSASILYWLCYRFGNEPMYGGYIAAISLGIYGLAELEQSFVWWQGLDTPYDKRLLLT